MLRSKEAKAVAKATEEATKAALKNGRKLGKVFVGAKRITVKELKQRLEAGELFNRARKGNKGRSNAGEDFVGTLKGEKVRLPGVNTEKIKYTKRTAEETEKLRKTFDSTERKKFLQGLSEDTERLKNVGMSDADIARMQDGFNPKGWQVHHRLPLDDSGTNNMDNLVLIKNDPYHKVITNYQNASTKGMLPGETKSLDWPMPKGNIYPPGK